MISYKQLTAKTMPPEKKRTASKCVIGHYLLRPVSNIISIPLIEWGINPTPVTMVSGIFPILAFFAFLLLPNDFGFWLGWLSILVWNILDGVDGNIARYCGKTSPRGGVWDATVGWLAMIVFYSGMGLVAFYHVGNSPIDEFFPSYYYLLMGDAAAMCWIFPRLVMHKTINTVSKEAAHEVQDRGNYGFAKLLFFNVTSINGGAAVLYTLCYVLHLTSLCMLFYFIVSMAVACGSLYKLLK